MVIAHPQFPTEPWQLRETDFDSQIIAQAESLFTLSNGHIGVRGNLDEGDPHGLPGTYVNSFYETRPLPYPEAGYGYPESGQAIVNVTDGKLIRLLIDDEPFDIRYGHVLRHERVLDLRAGVLRRTVEWRSPAGRLARISSIRLVSLVQRSILAVHYEVAAADTPIHVVVQSELVANEPVPQHTSDPRASAPLRDVLESLLHHGSDDDALLIHRARESGLCLAVAMAHRLPEGVRTNLSVEPDRARLTVSAQLEPGESLPVRKFVAYSWSGRRSVEALRDQVEAALVAGTDLGWDGLLAAQQQTLAEFWRGADIEIDGSPPIQQAARFALFHTFQSSARAEQRAIAAKGLTGPGYDGHAFWDTESFVLPVLSATWPDATADALRWRLVTLPLARDRAATLRLAGAAFPWRTIAGEECSGYWPAGSAALHVDADIANAVTRYVWWTGDAEFERTVGLPLLVETARLWQAAGYLGADGRFHLDGVTGPDEYSALSDDNVYTNLSARQNLLAAAAATHRWPAESAELEVTVDEATAWTESAGRMAMPFDHELGVHQQSRGYTAREVWDFARSEREGGYPLLLHAPYLQLYPKQVVKQADLVLAMHWFGSSFSTEEKARNFAYYDALTVRDSSLSACTQAVLAAEVGHLELAADYLTEAALIDVRDLEHNTRDGLHIASLAGTWIALVAGFGGLRDLGERLTFRPQLPPGWRRLTFTVRYRGSRITVAIGPARVDYRLTGDGPVTIEHAGQPVELNPNEPVSRPVCRAEPLTPPPDQPAGRRPASEREAAS